MSEQEDSSALQPERSESACDVPAPAQAAEDGECQNECAVPLLPGILQAEGYLSVREAARAMGVSVRSVYGYIESGSCWGFALGRR